MSTVTKPRKPAKAAAPIFDLAQVREIPHYVWREIERNGQEPLRVKLQDLSIRQTNAIPWGADVSMQAVYAAIAPSVVAWDFEAEDVRTGQMVAVPPPADAGPDVFELLSNDVAVSIVLWLKVPAVVKASAASAGDGDRPVDE